MAKPFWPSPLAPFSTKEIQTMSDKDMLGSLVRVLPHLTQAYLRLVLDVVNKLRSGDRQWFDEFKKFLRQEPSWILPTRLAVTSDGRTIELYLRSLEHKLYDVEGGEDYGLRSLTNGGVPTLRLTDFPTTKGKTYKLVVIRSDEFPARNREISDIRKEGLRRGYKEPPIEVAFLLRESVSAGELKRLGLWGLTVMHEWLWDGNGNPNTLFIGTRRGQFSDMYQGWPHDPPFENGLGFVFLEEVAEAK